jgi:DEAD/DEAH box helicase domain-containing protein
MLSVFSQDSPHNGSGDDNGDILGDMNKTVEWLQSQGYYEQQDEAHRVVPAQEPTLESADLHRSVESALRIKDIEQLYSHQVDALGHIRDDRNVVVATPTASGKTLCYTVPAFERAIENDSKTLYLAPRNALLQDQEETLQSLADNLGFGANITVRRYHSGLEKPHERREFKREIQPDVTMMTIDMAHTSLLPWAMSSSNWRWLFSQLDTIVIDEIHVYRGVFGSQVALLLRRLNRLAEQFGQDLQWICTSATIGNAVEHAANVTAQDTDSFELVDADGSSRGARHWLLWNSPLTKEEKQRLRGHGGDAEGLPTDDADDSLDGQGAKGGDRRSYHIQSRNLFCSLVARGYQVAVFSNTRQNCEQYAQMSSQMLRQMPADQVNEEDYPSLPDGSDPRVSDRIRAYHGQLDNEPRSKIETGLKTGAVRGVWSTSALGIGVDIGSLDCVILDGYPGSVMESFQWAGRAGRGDDECLVILVGSDNPLDQRVMEEPDRLLDAEPESAYINPENETLLDDHLVCAADEYPLSRNDEQWFGESYPDAVTQLTKSGRLIRRVENDGLKWRAPDSGIQFETNLRNTGEQIDLETTDGTYLGNLDLRSALRDAHPDAIYRSQLNTYRVKDVDYDDGTALLSWYHDQGTEEYTSLLYEKSVTVTDGPDGLETKVSEFDGFNIPVGIGEMTISKDIQGYNYYKNHKVDPEKRQFDDPLPEPKTTTTGFVLEMPSRTLLDLPDHVEQSDGDEDDTDGFLSGYLAALHAIEHALIGLLPTAVLCDRQDIGGLSTEAHRVTRGPAIFVHDAYEGGAGLSAGAFENIDELLERTYTQITECGCDDGCNRCVLSEYCGNTNRNIWKKGAEAVLAQILGKNRPT